MRTIILLSAVVIPIVFTVISWVSRAQRLDALQTYAQTHGYDFAGTKDFALDNELYNFELFQQGSSRYSLAFSAPDLRCGDLSWVTHSVRGKQTVWSRQRMSFCVFKLPCKLPSNLVVRVEGGVWDGWADIDIEGQQDFSDRFHVTSQNQSFAEAFLTTSAMQILMSNPTQIDLENGWLLIAKNFDLWKMDEFSKNIDTGRALVKESSAFCK